YQVHRGKCIGKRCLNRWIYAKHTPHRYIFKYFQSRYRQSNGCLRLCTRPFRPTCVTKTRTRSVNIKRTYSMNMGSYPPLKHSNMVKWGRTSHHFPPADLKSYNKMKTHNKRKQTICKPMQHDVAVHATLRNSEIVKTTSHSSNECQHKHESK